MKLVRWNIMENPWKTIKSPLKPIISPCSTPLIHLLRPSTIPPGPWWLPATPGRPPGCGPWRSVSNRWAPRGRDLATATAGRTGAGLVGTLWWNETGFATWKMDDQTGSDFEKLIFLNWNWWWFSSSQTVHVYQRVVDLRDSWHDRTF